MKLNFTVKKTTLQRKDTEIIASYSKNFNMCCFCCDNPWSDIYKYALFVDSFNKQYIVDLGYGHKVVCEIPDGALKGNYFSVSIFGNDRWTTTQERILIQPSGFTDETESILEAGQTETQGDSVIDIDNHKIWNYCYERRNLFEIMEHPYY